MKKIRNFAALLFALNVLSGSCSKEIAPQQEEVVADWRITADIESTKISYEDDGTSLNQAWEVGDGVVGWDEDGNALEFVIEKKEDISEEGRATFTLLHGVKTAEGKKIHLIYAPGKHWNDISSKSLSYDLSYQSQEDLPALLTASAIVNYSEPFLHFANRFAIIGIENPKVPDCGGQTVSCISLEGANVYTVATFSEKDGSLTMSSSAIGKITAECEIPIHRDGTTSNALVYMAVIPDATPADLSFRTVLPSGYKNVKKARSLAAGRYYAMSPVFKTVIPEAGTPSPIIMSSNIRYYGGTKKGDDVGDRAWEQRRTGYYAMVNAMQPAIVGMQEAEKNQINDIIGNCSGYAYIGRGREGFFTEDGESTSILYKEAEVTIDDWGTKWMSKYPDIPGTSFDDSSIRTATWAKVTFKTSDVKCFILNMHTSLSEELQAKEMTVIQNTIAEKNTDNLPVILTGDWNLEEDDHILAPIAANYQSARKTAMETDSRITFSPWYNNKHSHLDHIFYKGFNRCLQFTRVPDTWSGFSISDHYPIYAVLDFSEVIATDQILVNFDCPASATMDQAIQLTDMSSSANGIESWKWNVGGMVYTETNPMVSFKTFGDAVPVTLTVMDGSHRTASVTKYVNVTKSSGHDLSIAWARNYDSDGRVYWTSPASNAAGDRIYVSSSGYHLVCYDNNGTQRGSFDIGMYGPYIGDDNNFQTPTPSVDNQGNVYIPVQYRYSSEGHGGLFAIGPECSGLLWYFNTGATSQYEFVIPAHIGENVGILMKNGNQETNCLLIDRKNGGLVQSLPCDKGSLGGMALTPAGQIVYGTNRGNSTEFGSGYKVAVPNSTFNQWNTSAATEAGSAYNLLSGTDPSNGYGYISKGCQPAISNIDGSAYVCVTSDGTSMICARYNLNNYSVSATPKLIWKTEVKATVLGNGHGMVLDNFGNAYLQTGDRVFRLNASNGEVVWEYKTDSGNCGVPAIDNEGYVYLCDFHGHKFLKLSPADGSVIASINDFYGLRSSPTITSDGSIYITGSTDGDGPALYKITCPKTTGPGSNWSQLGCNQQKTCCFPGATFSTGTREDYLYDNLFK